ncbi:hypothetical protein Vadar_010319 [Vaccinium darrowii]|uniref:Uncharacterized protein n=1 Tax=Vaccinium darrowii TaxID=229202 RepID=A0ACB7XPM8_9ERIC|nr:hypothetical protein Vadar_010319 [Vaccinium darrowii]
MFMPSCIVGNVEALSYYGEQNPNFHRCSYWMLDPAYERIVLVHYRDIREFLSRKRSLVSSWVFDKRPEICLPMF